MKGYTKQKDATCSIKTIKNVEGLKYRVATMNSNLRYQLKRTIVVAV